MSRWYYIKIPQRQTFEELDFKRIREMLLTATSNAVLGGEFFSTTEYGREHGLERHWFSANSGL